MCARLLLFLTLAFSYAGHAQSDPPECIPCTTTVNTTPVCGSFTVTEIPTSFTCGDVTDTQNTIPFTGSTACSFSDAGTMVGSMTCKHNVPVSCDPCCGSCPPSEPRVSGNSANASQASQNGD